jgi:predicted esterase
MGADLIHRFVPGSPSLTILALHEEGANETDLLPICRAVAPGAAILSPRLPASPTIVAEWLIGAAARYSFDLSSVCALGYSTGADLGIATILAHPQSVTGAILFRPHLVTPPEPLPQLAGIPVLLIAGRGDARVPVADSEALGRLLSEAGASVDLAIVESDHGLTPQDFSLAKRWFARSLLRSAALRSVNPDGSLPDPA